MCSAMRGFRTFIDVILLNVPEQPEWYQSGVLYIVKSDRIFKPYINSPSHLKTDTYIKLVDRLGAPARN